ncbi:MAG: YdeI/OmpD-associated family protein [Candidatus Dojkabacteria bacterium]
MKFKTKLFSGGGNTAGFEIPEDVVMSFGKGKRVPVVVTINGYSYRNTIAIYNGVYMLGVSMENREKAGAKVGDKLEIDLEYDDKPRVVEVPEDLQKELDKDKKAKEFFDSLSNSHKKQYTLWIEGTKNPETRAGRVQKAIEMLKEQRKK